MTDAFSNPWTTPNLRTITTPAPNWRPNGVGVQGATSGQIAAQGALSQRGTVQATPLQQHAAYQLHAPNSARATPAQQQQQAALPQQLHTPASAAAAAAASQGLSSLPAPSRARSLLLQAATSMGLHGWNSVAPAAASADASAPMLACPSRFDAADSAGGLADFDSWLAHSSRVVDVMRAHSALQQEAAALQTQLEAHEREEETADVTGVAGMEAHSAHAWALAQHLSALMSGQSDLAVEDRNPQPSQFHLIARDHAAASQGGGGSQFTPAPLHVHPALRQLLQQPYGQANNFIQIEPELQGVVCSEIEAMCRDVSEWREPSQEAAPSTTGQTLSPTEALAWSSTLQTHQKPMEEILSSVVSSWARVQRAGDSLSSLHAVTKQLHQLEQQCDRMAQQQRDEAAERALAATAVTRY